MDYVDSKYCNLITNYLKKAKVKNNYPFRLNFRCPLCGDSHKSENKARGWILEDDKNHLHFFCHNCSASMSFGDFLKEINPSIFDDYLKEKLLEKYQGNNFSKSKADKDIIEKMIAKPVFGLENNMEAVKLIDLPKEHFARQYVESRKIPENCQELFYFTENFKKFTNNFIPDKFENLNYDEPRLIIPFYDKNKKFFAYQGRSFKEKTKIRYITIMLDENQPKIFGLDRVNFNYPYYVVEGPIDSLFIDNCLAMAGASIHYECLENPENCVFVLDNEPRKPETVAKMKKIIKKGFKICIWNRDIKEKDINDMILSGITKKSLIKLINFNTFSGLEASLAISKWRKVNA